MSRSERESIIKDILSDFPELFILQDKDNKMALNFFNQSSMNAKDISLSYDRSPNFFDFLRLQSDEYYVFAGKKNQSDELCAIGTLIIRDAYLNKKTETIAYLGDLRVKAGIKYAKRWQEFLALIIKNQNKLKIESFITAIMSDNSKAKKALTHHKSFHYKLLTHYKMINLILPYSLNRHSPRQLSVSRASKHDIEEVLSFYKDENLKKDYAFTSDFLKKAIKSWPNFKAPNFIILRDHQDMIGMCATWTPRHCKKIIIDQLSRSLKATNVLLSPIKKKMILGEELKVLYLSFISLKETSEFNLKTQLSAILNFLRKEKTLKNYHLISLADTEPYLLTKNLQGWIYQSTNLELYTVTANKSESIENKSNISIEIALI